MVEKWLKAYKTLATLLASNWFKAKCNVSAQVRAGCDEDERTVHDSRLCVGNLVVIL